MNDLAVHYTRFRVSERLLMTGHSHQAWPDVAFEGHVEAFEDAARHVDEKWERAFAKAERVRAGLRTLLGDPGAEIALGANTHELVIRFLSTLDLRKRRLVTTDGEFHALRRQLDRLNEVGIDIVRVPARPVQTLGERLLAEVDASTAAVLVSAVLFEDSLIVPRLDGLATACEADGVELLVDTYHALGVIPFRIGEQGLASAWVVGGGYKYLQLGEGNAYLRIPPHAHDARPVITGWFAEFEELQAAHSHAVGYPKGASAFAGATYDPTSNYRAARVLDFFDEQGLTPERLRASYVQQLELMMRTFDELDLDEEVVSRDRATPVEALGGFLSLRSPHAGGLQAALADLGVLTDHRANFLRLGPAPYLADAQIERSIAFLGEAVQKVSA